MRSGSRGRTGDIDMNNEKVYGMRFGKVYPLLVSKAEKKLMEHLIHFDAVIEHVK